jgi:arginine/lysine/ornithine decarboxylase
MSANLNSHTEESRLLTDKTVLECSLDTYFVTHSDKKSSQPVETSSCLNVIKDDHQIDTSQFSKSISLHFTPMPALHAFVISDMFRIHVTVMFALQSKSPLNFSQNLTISLLFRPLTRHRF